MKIEDGAPVRNSIRERAGVWGFGDKISPPAGVPK
jgi:hypothetical protein